MMEKRQGEAIAALMSALRADWDYPGCFAAVGAVKDRNPHDVAMAAVRLCATTEAKTPAVLKIDGPHWREKVAPSLALFPPRKDEACPKHPGEWPGTCRGCASDRIAGELGQRPPRPPNPPPPDLLAAMRADIAAAKHVTAEIETEEPAS